MKKRTFLFLIVTLFLTKVTTAQISSSFYMSNEYSSIGVGYDFHNRLWSEIRMYGNLKIEDFTVEPVVAYNFITSEDFHTYVGVGFNINYITGPTIPLGIHIKPFEQLPNFKFLFEANPYYNIDSETFIFYCAAGFRYCFK